MNDKADEVIRELWAAKDAAFAAAGGNRDALIANAKAASAAVRRSQAEKPKPEVMLASNS